VLEADSKDDSRFTANADALKKQGVNDYQLSYALQTLARLAPAGAGTRIAQALPPTPADVPTAN
jgi:carboxyl-terminal processing protease